MASPQEIVDVAGTQVVVTNPTKVLFPKAGHTKMDLVRYFLAVAPAALRGIKDRPLVMKRYVDGVEAEAFYQKRVPDKRPDFIRTTQFTFPSGRTANELVIDDAAGLAWMANLACIELHAHPIRVDDHEHPDELRIDLDPVPGVEWPQVVAVAKVVRAVLDDVGLVSWPKTSGSRGIHVLARLHRRWGFIDLRRAAIGVAREVAHRVPALATTAWWKEQRHGVFLDYNQNAPDRTTAAAYSVRPTPDARVSVPFFWRDVDAVDPAAFTVATVPAHLATHGDAHDGIDAAAGSLDGALALAARHEAIAEFVDEAWPAQFPKRPGEPKRVRPSAAKKPGAPRKRRAAKAAGGVPAVATDGGAPVHTGAPDVGDGKKPRRRAAKKED